MSGFPWLSLILWMPLLAGLALIARGRETGPSRISTAWWLSLASSLLTLILCMKAPMESGPSLWKESIEWIPSLGVAYELGMDGMACIMLALTALIMPVSIAASQRAGYNHEGFAGCLLVIQGTLVGVFTAQNFFAWFFFYEIALVPAYFLIRLWGGPGKEKVSLRFFLYSMLGSIALLVGYLGIASAVGSYNFTALAEASATQALPEAIGQRLAWFDLPVKWLITLLFALTFGGLAVKVGMVPAHGWLPDTYEKAPTPVTMVLTGLMSKMGLVGMVKMVIPLLPYVPSSVLQAALAIAVFGLVYAALAAMGQTSFKRLLAYSSINHLGYCLIALLVLGQASMGEPSMQTAKTFALGGLLLQMFSHGLIAAGLFYLTHLGESRLQKTLRVDGPGGLRAIMPRFAGWMGLAVFASIGLPGLSGFIGEFLIFRGVFALSPWVAIGSLPALLITAIFLLRFLQHVFHGKSDPESEQFSDLSGSEMALMAPLFILIVLLGWFPHLIMERINPTIILTIERMIF